MEQRVERRTFLKSTVAGLGALGAERTARGSSASGPASNIAHEPLPFTGDGYKMPEWLHYARTVYFDGYSPPVYPHMKDFDARRLVEAVAEVGGELLRFQPIGYWAYYPSQSFRVHPELGGRDLIDEVGRECRRQRIHFYCYTGYGHAHMELGWVDKHPRYADWVLRDPEGKPYGSYAHIGWGARQRICTTGDAYRAGIRQVVRELCQHDTDGVYFDAPSAFGYTGICFCASCRAGFEKFSGLDLDRLASLAKGNGLPFELNEIPSDVDLPALTAWYAWAHQMTQEDFLDFRKIIHGSGKFMLCHNANAWGGQSLHGQYRIPEGFMVESSREVYERLMTGMMGASMARPYGKMAQMYLGSYALSWFGEPPHERPWVLHNTSREDTDEIRMEGLTNLACGNTPLYCTGNRLYFQVGSGNTQPLKEVFSVMKQAEEFHRGSVPVPYLSIVPTWESLQLWRTRRKSWNWPMMTAGMGLALLEERISVDVNPSPEMSDDWLRTQRVIALCGASGLSDHDGEKLARWVEGGGGLLATYDTGLYDEWGELRTDGGALGKLLGVGMKGEPLESQPECYYRVKESHPALGDYVPGSVVQGDGRLVPVEAVGDGRILAECWNLGTGEVRGPGIIANTYGRGRTLYISGSLEANFLYDRVESTGRLIRSMVQYLGKDLPQPFRLKAPRGVYGVLRQAPNGDLALWVLGNVGFKDAAIGRMRQAYLPVNSVEVAVRIPQGREAKKMLLIRAARQIEFRVEEGYAVGEIPTLHIGEIVHLTLA